MKYDFCIYTPGEPDYWGQFESQRELFEYLSLAVPGFNPHECYRPTESNEFRANYRVGDTLIVVMEPVVPREVSVEW